MEKTVLSINIPAMDKNGILCTETHRLWKDENGKLYMKDGKGFVPAGELLNEYGGLKDERVSEMEV